MGDKHKGQKSLVFRKRDEYGFPMRSQDAIIGDVVRYPEITLQK